MQPKGAGGFAPPDKTLFILDLLIKGGVTKRRMVAVFGIARYHRPDKSVLIGGTTVFQVRKSHSGISLILAHIKRWSDRHVSA
jgi:hypothetical protein